MHNIHDPKIQIEASNTNPRGIGMMKEA